KKSWEQMSENERARYQDTAKGFRPDGTYDLNMLKAMLTRVNPANLQHLRVAPDLLKIVLNGAGRVPLVAGVLGAVAVVGLATQKISGAAIRITAPSVVMIGIIRQKRLADHSSQPDG
ncbi:hypothetical protein, partial [Pseudomonas viridiflava]